MGKENIHIANKKMKRCLASLAIREMQIKITINYHLTPTKMDRIKLLDNNMHWQGVLEKLDPSYITAGDVK